MAKPVSISLNKFTASVQAAVKSAVVKHPKFNVPTPHGVSVSYLIRGIPVPDEILAKVTLAETQAFATEIAGQIAQAHPEALGAARPAGQAETQAWVVQERQTSLSTVMCAVGATRKSTVAIRSSNEGPSNSSTLPETEFARSGANVGIGKLVVLIRRSASRRRHRGQGRVFAALTSSRRHAQGARRRASPWDSAP